MIERKKLVIKLPSQLGVLKNGLVTFKALSVPHRSSLFDLSNRDTGYQPARVMM